MRIALLYRIGAVGLGVVLAVLGIALADRVLIARWAPPFRYLLPPGSRMQYTTCEFDWVTNVNSVGLRDREFDFARKQGLRILALGDSFTFGWGVNDDECWPKLLERLYQEHGMAAEVVNAGAAGTGTGAYADIAEDLVPVIRPDVILVGVLQGDDFAQAVPLGPPREPPPHRRWGRALAGWVCPNCYRAWRLRGLHRPLIVEMREVWQMMAQGVEARLGPREAERFARVDPEVRTLFRSGDLNTALVNMALVDPDHYTKSFHLAEQQARLGAMTRHFERLQAVASRHGATVIICSIPHGPYVTRRQFEATRRIGFDVEEDFLNSDGADEATRLASARAGVPFLTILKEFRAAAARQLLYFEWDGHFNRSGHQVFAQLLFDRLQVSSCCAN